MSQPPSPSAGFGIPSLPMANSTRSENYPRVSVVRELCDRLWRWHAIAFASPSQSTYIVYEALVWIDNARSMKIRRLPNLPRWARDRPSFPLEGSAERLFGPVFGTEFRSYWSEHQVFE